MQERAGHERGGKSEPLTMWEEDGIVPDYARVSPKLRGGKAEPLQSLALIARHILVYS